MRRLQRRRGRLLHQSDLMGLCVSAGGPSVGDEQDARGDPRGVERDRHGEAAALGAGQVAEPVVATG